jgi:hypothetical protein
MRIKSNPKERCFCVSFLPFVTRGCSFAEILKKLKKKKCGHKGGKNRTRNLTQQQQQQQQQQQRKGRTYND